MKWERPSPGRRGTGLCQGHMEATIAAAKGFAWETPSATKRILSEPIGGCALITPWNWPMNQIVCKVAPAIVASCMVLLKPSEIAPMSGLFIAEFMDEAGAPRGVSIW